MSPAEHFRSNGQPGFLAESKIQPAFVYSLSWLFVQATDLFKSIKTDRLPTWLKTPYGWSMIRYYENLMKYTDDAKYTALYEQKFVTQAGRTL